jgi:hypothetical protein
MFGYVIANVDALSPAQKERYRACYCGLCRAIGRRCSQGCRLSLTYDLVFLTLVLNSLYEPEERTEERPCPVHPFRRRRSWASGATDYAADMNVLLARLSALDHWRDERRLLGLGEAKLLEKGAERAALRHPRQAALIAEALARLGEIEARREPDPEPGADAFGELMAGLFLWREDRWAPLLRELGRDLGRFVYLLDAVLDREKDLRRGLYNPVQAMMESGAGEAEVRDILTSLMADCAGAWEKLPLLRDAELQRNILYTGVWTRLPRTEEANT